MPDRRKKDPRDLLEGQRLLQVLRTAMTVLGMNRKQVQNRAGFSAGYLSRLFRGAYEVRLEQLLAIARAIGLEPAELFHLAYPQRPEPPSKAAAEVRRVLMGPPEPPAGTRQERFAQLCERIQSLLPQVQAEMFAVLEEPGPALEESRGKGAA
jgi:transcriptional regulator with XRE-family HTH domain